ncbi:hypothetical protein [Thiohalobacter thiocyanaticus]|uniref:HNH domain-containing protein n=1 Tax=Thiohalobacter thiocyanaticus TaxID=585455 RepID=A0A426QGB8_9GAMM|nr:hypothetical protein [Thiohalobacter thiocyanaticus]RRQ20794.1 hypothetical protein D6C00_01570 [Thiohalobacter thiocyanaticus]
MSNPTPKTCALCDRAVPLTFHHLIPRKVHRRNHFAKRYTKEKLAQGINICRRCHNGIHNAHDEMTLAKTLNTLEKLRRDAKVRRHVEWVRTQKK